MRPDPTTTLSGSKDNEGVTSHSQSSIIGPSPQDAVYCHTQVILFCGGGRGVLIMQLAYSLPCREGRGEREGEKSTSLYTYLPLFITINDIS